METKPKLAFDFRVFMHAQHFNKALVKLHDHNNPGDMAHYGYPILVLAAFASELMLKCLVFMDTGKQQRGHLLFNLFNQLKPETQGRLEELWNMTWLSSDRVRLHEAIERQVGHKIPRDLRSSLLAGNKGFERLRYIYEEGQEESSFGLGDLPWVLRTHIFERRPLWRTIAPKVTEVPTSPSHQTQAPHAADDSTPPGENR